MGQNVILKAPEGATSLSVGGETKEIVDGLVAVPAEYVADLIGAHGYGIPANVSNEMAMKVDEKLRASIEAESKADKAIADADAANKALAEAQAQSADADKALVAAAALKALAEKEQADLAAGLNPTL